MVPDRCLGQELILGRVDGMPLIFMLGLEMGDVIPHRLNGKVAQLSRLSPSEKPSKFFPIAPNGRESLSLGAAC